MLKKYFALTSNLEKMKHLTVVMICLALTARSILLDISLPMLVWFSFGLMLFGDYMSVASTDSRDGGEDKHVSQSEMRKTDIRSAKDKDAIGYCLMLIMCIVFTILAIVTRHPLPLLVVISLLMGIVTTYLVRKYGHHFR